MIKDGGGLVGGTYSVDVNCKVAPMLNSFDALLSEMYTKLPDSSSPDLLMQILSREHCCTGVTSMPFHGGIDNIQATPMHSAEHQFMLRKQTL